MAPEEGAYLRDKMSGPTYTPPPPMLSTSTKVAKWGPYMQDTTVLHVLSMCVSNGIGMFVARTRLSAMCNIHTCLTSHIDVGSNALIALYQRTYNT